MKKLELLRNPGSGSAKKQYDNLFFFKELR